MQIQVLKHAFIIAHFSALLPHLRLARKLLLINTNEGCDVIKVVNCCMSGLCIGCNALNKRFLAIFE